MPDWSGDQRTILPPAAAEFDFAAALSHFDEHAPDRLEAYEPLLAPVLSRSAYLCDLASRHTEWLAGSLEQSPDDVLDDLLKALAEHARTENDKAGMARRLRIAKGQVALLTGLAECAGGWTTQQATAGLTRFADAALDAAVTFLARAAADAGKLLLAPELPPARQSGLILFALGKQGGGELNYSSDIDIVAFYDADRAALTDPEDAPRFYQRMVRNLAALIEERDPDGYVFRMDLRLRPDPASTPVAIPVDSAMVYYESRGQNWERAAWIRARASAGDIQGGEQFLNELAPFIWRKHLDFATIADIQAMKRQINAARGGAMVPQGHNIKLGRGGIREIEFFVQTQQLITGGRAPEVRARPTVVALEELRDLGLVDSDTAARLAEHYWFLRAVENRVQMRRDEQTHILPDTEPDFAHVAGLMGFADPEAFATRYAEVTADVSGIYSGLFEQEMSLASEMGDLVFTGGENDPGTLETLSQLGFADPVAASDLIRNWHYGGYAATRATKARQHLTELVPILIDTLARLGNPDAALKRFDIFLGRLPTGVQFFALMRANPPFMRMFVEFLAIAPRLTEAVIRRVHVVDALIDSSSFGHVPTEEELAERIDVFLGEARSYEDLLDRARIAGQEQIFLASAGLVAGAIPAPEVGKQYAAIAETLMTRLDQATSKAFAWRHGEVPGSETALVGFGKLASREMTATSDLDFILLFKAPPEVDESDGTKPLAPPHYFTRLTQRLVAAISSPTAEGILYEADMRLRPSGNKGPLATGLAGFLDYQRKEARTWEHMALARARILGGKEAFGGELAAEIRAILDQPRDRAATLSDIAEMRALIDREKKPKTPFDLKLVPGGLIDLEFIAQAAQLLDRPNLEDPSAQPAAILRQLASAGLLPEGDRLSEIHETYTTVLQLMSACLSNPLDMDGWTAGFRDLVCRMTHFPDYDRLEAGLADMGQEVRSVFEKWVAG